jgi:hypothetical protein
MRVVSEKMVGDLRISIFAWNNKYILKYELGPFEQTYKVSESDIIDEDSLNSFLEGEFVEFVDKKFKEMGQFFVNHLEKIGF